jgi:hypothetical protein
MGWDGLLGFWRIIKPMFGVSGEVMSVVFVIFGGLCYKERCYGYDLASLGGFKRGCSGCSFHSRSLEASQNLHLGTGKLRPRHVLPKIRMGGGGFRAALAGFGSWYLVSRTSRLKLQILVFTASK